MRYAYLDSSAIVKLVAREAETAALEHDLADRDGLLTSGLSLAEVTRAVGRVKRPKLLQRVADVFDALVLVDVTRPILMDAATIPPAELRSLDAIHLATARSLHGDDGNDLDFITYDDRLAKAARAADLTVRQPGR